MLDYEETNYIFRSLKRRIKMFSLPDDIDIPESRRNLSDDGNVRWLLRNLAIRNNNHPKFKFIINELKKLHQSWLQR